MAKVIKNEMIFILRRAGSTAELGRFDTQPEAFQAATEIAREQLFDIDVIRHHLIEQVIREVRVIVTVDETDIP
jgi:hypothetical protein